MPKQPRVIIKVGETTLTGTVLDVRVEGTVLSEEVIRGVIEKLLEQFGAKLEGADE